MISRALTTTPLLAVLATGLAACGGGSGSSSGDASAAILTTLRAHYVNLADAKLDAACNDQTVGFQNAFARSFDTNSCPAAMQTYRRHLTALGSWTKAALRNVDVTGLKVTGATATATVHLSDPAGGAGIPMGQVRLVRAGGQWMISNVLAD